MRALPDHRIGLLVIPILLLCLHILLRQQTFSFVVLPIAIAGALPYLLPNSLVALLTTTITAELLSSTPPGIMTAAIITPFVVRRFIHSIEPSFTTKFFGVVLLTTAIQFSFIAGALIFETLSLPHIAGPRLFRALPILQLLGSLTATAVTLFLCIASWYEWVAPARVQSRGIIRELYNR